MAWIEFQHITDEMYLWKKYDCIKKEIDKMNKKTKQKLKELEDDFWIDYYIWEPYFIDWNSDKDSEYNRYWQKRNQRRYNIRIRKDKWNRKITRNEIYCAMNKIYITSYNKI